MLKFSGFADLTSCQGNVRKDESTAAGSKQTLDLECPGSVSKMPQEANALDASRAKPLVHRHEQPTQAACQVRQTVGKMLMKPK